MASLDNWRKQLKQQHPTLTRVVDGNVVSIEKAEYDAQIEEWAQVNYRKEIAKTVKADGGKHANYAEFRREAYGSIGDQLDMQYKDAVNGTTTWLDHIAAVKAKYQKP
tara:strand:+ start:174 stop:497 length:324 start_codon:yes stop_codon:yes gene_type:complete